MKTLFRNILILLGILGLIGIVCVGIILYSARYKRNIVDTVQSPDGVYEVALRSIGEPQFPFGSAPGALVLGSKEDIISKADFKIANDGGPIREYDWNVTWYEDSVEIILSGEEQKDERITMYYDGQVERLWLSTHFLIESKVNDDTATDTTSGEDDLEYELFPGEQQIREGYQAIYDRVSDGSVNHFEVSYGASESSTRCMVSEDNDKIEYLVYHGRSQNEKCGIYVHYESKKESDGTWPDANAVIVDIYAYLYENGDVVSSGKKHWDDIGSEPFQMVTGEL